MRNILTVCVFCSSVGVAATSVAGETANGLSINGITYNGTNWNGTSLQPVPSTAAAISDETPV